jgi:uncharacterized protein YycO
MKKIKSIILSAFLMVAGTTVRAQNLNAENGNIHANKPQVHINVKKAYDKNGNIIRYDSTYEWTYSSHNGKQDINLDSLMGHFMPFFRENLPDSLSRVFGNPNLNPDDSAMMMNFFNNAHFFDQWQKEVFDMNHEMQAMDSLRMEFLKNYMRKKKHSGKRRNPLKAGVF